MDNLSLIDSYLYFWIALNVFLNILVFLVWKKKYHLRFGLQKYQAIQRIHLKETPRLGGVIFLICLAGYVFTSDFFEGQHLLRVLVFITIPAAIIALREDLLHDVEPAIRLMALLFSGWLFRALYAGAYPDMGSVPLIRDLLMVQGGMSFFYILSATSIANGMNLIDGVNGLCGSVALTVLVSLFFLANLTGDTATLTISLTLIIMLIPFMASNFPFGHIFLGDVGAYVLGILLSGLTIIFFGRHPELSPWNAAVALIYPTTEILFTVLRRVFTGRSIYLADRYHLHLKLFYFLRPRYPFKKISGALVTPILSMLWLFPLIMILMFHNHPNMLIASIVVFWTIYVGLYFALPLAPERFDHED
jgi:UDP-N-acetylmuramyl pentapeptide phosphotransferase/UDP-N-acetylglucosamine-1-phosphate transferase